MPLDFATRAVFCLAVTWPAQHGAFVPRASRQLAPSRPIRASPLLRLETDARSLRARWQSAVVGGGLARSTSMQRCRADSGPSRQPRTMTRRVLQVAAPPAPPDVGEGP